MKFPAIESRFITDAAAAGSVSTGAYSWLANVNEWLQLISLLISIGLGLYAYYRIFRKDK